MILVFDIGTTTVKGALFSGKGELINSKSARVHLQSTDGAGRHEVNPDEWMRAMGTLCGSLLAAHGPAVEAITISGNGPTIVASDSNGRALRPAITWLDRRGLDEAAFVRERCGVFVDSSFYLPKVLWLKNNEPATYDNAAHFLSCSEYVAFRLTGEPVMVFPGEGLENLVWTERMIRELDLDEQKFPPFVGYGQRIGKVTADAAVSLGIPKGIPVFGGGPDFMMSILGTASVKPGKACDRAGTSEGVNVCTAKRVKDDKLLCYRHIVPEFWNVAGIISTSGKALEWYGESLLGGAFSYETLDRMASAAAPGSRRLIFLPYLSGERTPIWDPHARGVFLGLALHHNTGDLARAVLESTGYAIRDVLSLMGENGIIVDEMTVAGSPAKSDTWNQIKADITGKRILVPENLDSELVGDACMAMYRLGRYASPAEAATELVKIQKVIEPLQDNRRIYTELFEIYKETYNRLKPVFFHMAGKQAGGAE